MARHVTNGPLPGTFQATPDAKKTIDHIERELTGWYAGNEIDVTNLVDKALSLAGLFITVDSQDDKACIQSLS